ncbi:hypothetical protein THAPSDRAFT_261631 [Thalassiosira pseudonana CCMP1335]
MLNAASSSNESTTVSLCVTDPSLVDNPIVYVSNGFCQLTGYSYDDVIGRNCRFLQGPETRREDVDKIVVAVKGGVECSVNLLNYKKDGTTFRNEFYLAQLRSPTQDISYFIGIQAAVDVHEDGGDSIACVTDLVPSNPGVYLLECCLYFA